ncbi:hypothetical protein F1559_002964 [Cyanidiococcus yangmingshanensis]|uniref:Proteasome assembly chaperone 2 n=1 Tax=Cyanidiococcus yangmingshanensis TaxID=2690220 RepID=A0A7J7IP54_9RHOD|nr:hypothetical protein F1559_002964 [Cyanidiococcus yangmingshanensis]
MNALTECWALEARTQSGGVLVVPNTLATAYVPQLACDLLIENLALPHLSLVRVPQLLPFAGRGEYSHIGSRFQSPADLYGDHEVVVLQQRSPVARGRSREHARLLWGTFGEPGRVILVLNSINAIARESARALAAPSCCVWYLANPAGRVWIERLSTDWLELCEADVSPLYWPLARGSSWISSLFEGAKPEDALVVLQVFAHSGDSREMARILSKSVAAATKRRIQDWRAPPTWTHVMDST